MSDEYKGKIYLNKEELKDVFSKVNPYDMNAFLKELDNIYKRITKEKTEENKDLNIKQIPKY